MNSQDQQQEIINTCDQENDKVQDEFYLVPLLFY